ncbi:MAG: hypothetical protein ACRDVD_02670, partial [Acidimicrobiia bacterium]
MNDELRTLERRYGDLGTDITWDRLVMKQNRNRARLDVIDDQLDELSVERRRLQSEDRRIELVKCTLVDEIAQQVRERENEGWSPTPVVGYRVWSIVSDTVVGATGHPWRAPVIEAECDGARPDDDLPHTDHLCSRVGHGCGIYASVQPGPVTPAGSTDWVVGIVLLSGKVVEHEHGYRAAHARVAALVAHSDDRLLVTGDATKIDALFTSPTAALAEFGDPRQRPLHGV